MTTPSPPQESPWHLYGKATPTEKDGNHCGNVVIQTPTGNINQAHWTNLQSPDWYWARHSDLPPLPVVTDPFEQWAKDYRLDVHANYISTYRDCWDRALKEGRAEGAREVREEITKRLNEEQNLWPVHRHATTFWNQLRAIVAGKE